VKNVEIYKDQYRSTYSRRIRMTPFLPGPASESKIKIHGLKISKNNPNY